MYVLLKKSIVTISLAIHPIILKTSIRCHLTINYDKTIASEDFTDTGFTMDFLIRQILFTLVID